MKKSAMQIISTGVMSIMRHCMQSLKADQMLFQQHGSKLQLKNSYTRRNFFPDRINGSSLWPLQEIPLSVIWEVNYKSEPLIRESEWDWEAEGFTFCTRRSRFASRVPGCSWAQSNRSLSLDLDTCVAPREQPCEPCQQDSLAMTAFIFTWIILMWPQGEIQTSAEISVLHITVISLPLTQGFGCPKF